MEKKTGKASGDGTDQADKIVEIREILAKMRRIEDALAV